jgi:iron complex outermembrane receptor protein
MMLVLPFVIYAQKKDTTLSDFTIQGKKNQSNEVKVNEFSPGQKIKTIDSATLQQYEMQGMPALLAQQSSVFIKSYGVNGLATMNFRGSSAAQSIVLWNGVPIQNAALGIADISTISVSLMNKVNVVYGGSSALWGSGNVGGALLLENETPVFEPGKKSLTVNGGAGSFGQFMGSLKGSVSGRKFYCSANAFGQGAENNFSYKNLYGLNTKMQNGALQSGSVLLHAAVNDSPLVINAYLWLQKYVREIPPALFEATSVKKQTDGSTRFLVDWQREVGKSALNGKLAYISDKVSYHDDAISIRSENTVRQVYLELGWRKQFGRYGQLLIFAPCQLSWAGIGPKDGDTVQQERAGIAGAYQVKLFGQRLNIALNVREELIDGKDIFLPGGSASFRLTDWLSLRANVQRTYRTPTLNELYYFPGGNKNLKAEHGLTEDAGYIVKARIQKVAVTHDLAVFNREMKDWIYWVGGAILTPHNIAEVHSRGVETETKLGYAIGKWRLHLGVNTSYVLATTEKSYIQNDGSIGKQIPYTPRYNHQLNAGFAFKALSLNYNHTYTGYRFTTTDESPMYALLPYETGNLQLMYNRLFGKHSLQLIAACNNIWNQNYQVVDQRPMPGINWQVGLKAGIF